MANKGKHRLFHNATPQVLHKAHTEEHPSLKQSKAKQQMMLACFLSQKIAPSAFSLDLQHKRISRWFPFHKLLQLRRNRTAAACK
jgi:hypothetical protein